MKRLNIEVVIKAMLAVMAVLLILPGLVFAQERLSVKSGIANMRSGPGTKYDVLWQVEQYHPVTIVKKKGNWYKIKDFENDEAWLHKSLLGKIAGVITMKDKCNVRSGPGTNSPVVFTVEKGVPFKVLTRKGNWINIEHADGDVGWIYKTLVW
ncbi:MAG: SH3 domain-containing protein [Desulfobacula sp.]|uniref:SH3 domain-containing protein n=1 Tax=Desulfobacula sp. TaxID=2593537 RepID=UPI0025BD70D9|nr:SH3 domain-containing protein [Desulfobacula sp.]MCD4719923.1 SH3 domain-containing protein [Desulfobacula sp.]